MCSIFCVLPKIIYLCPALSGGSESGRGAKVFDGGRRGERGRRGKKKGRKRFVGAERIQRGREQGESRFDEGEAWRRRIGLE